MKKVQTIIIILVLIEFVSGRKRTERQESRCKNSCVLLRKCDPFLAMLQSQQQKAQILIKSNICRIKGYRVMVCCSKKENFGDFFPSECGNNPRVAHKIVFGENTTMGEFPWAVALGYPKPNSDETEFNCVGSLINKRYVLTAAHCLRSHKNGMDFNITELRLGDWDLSKELDCVDTQVGKKCAPKYITARAERIIIHPKFNEKTLLAADIGLIRLDKTIDLIKARGYITPICLPPFGINPRKLVHDNRNMTVIGWGNTESGKPSSILLKASIPFANPQDCKSYYFHTFGQTHLCAGGLKQDSCQGDSGAPLMLAGPDAPPYLQVGIVSFGQLCGAPGVPAVYTSVSAYKLWIRNNMEPWDD